MELTATFMSNLYISDSFRKRYAILICGKAGVGKTTSAEFLKDILSESGRKVRIDNFAKGVKNVAISMGWDGLKNEKGRQLLQSVGNVGREYNMNLWAKQLESRLEKDKDFDYVLIDDWRFPNEKLYLQSSSILNGIYTVRVIASSREILYGTPAYYDISETSLDNGIKTDFEIKNMDYIEMLKYNLSTIVDLIIRKET